MSYEYKDEDTDVLRIEGTGDAVVVRGRSWIPNTAVPRVALEILKAAGVGQYDMEDAALADAFNALRKYLWRQEVVEQEAALKKRRDELAAEFTSTAKYSGQLTYTQNLINRIIELEARS